MFLEEFAKERLVGEIQFFRYFLDGFRGVLQQHANLQRDIVVNPLVGGSAAYALDGFQQVFCGDAHLLAVPCHAPLMAEVLFHQSDEGGEEMLCACLPAVADGLHAVDDVAQVIHHRGHQRASGVTAEVMLLVIHFLFQHVEIAHEGVHLLLCEMADGMLSGEEKECRQLMDIADNLAVEVAAYHDTHTVAVAAYHEVVGYLADSQDQQVAGLYGVQYGVDTVLRLSLQAQCQQAALHASRGFRERKVRDVMKEHQVVVNETALINLFGSLDRNLAGFYR